MPTICLDCRYITSRPSGIGTIVRALVDHLPEMAPDWHFKLLRQASVEQTLSNAPNVTEVLVSAETNGPASMWFLPQLVDLDDVDLFHAPSNILPRGLTMPCVTTIHDVMWLTTPELCRRGLWGYVEQSFYSHGMRRALRKSKAILTVSEATRTAVIDLDSDLADRTFAHLPGIADDFQPQPVTPAEMARMGLAPGQYVLTVGQNAPYKNHQAVLRGFAAAFSDRPEIELVMVQRQGGKTRTLRDLAEQLGIAGRVKFLPVQTQSDLMLLYNGALALLHPSLCEGFGMPIAEAMACGCPIVTSERSAMPEVAAGSALLVNPCDDASIAAALKKIETEPELTSKMRKKGLLRASQLDWQAFAEGHLAVYRGVLADS